MLQLNNDDFMGFTIGYPGIVVVYFKQSWCSGCEKFDPIFLQIERKKNQHGLQTIQFATVNVSLPANTQIVKKAKDANVLIDKTPMLIIFYQSTPYAKYHGPLDEDNIFTFIKQVLTNEVRTAPQSDWPAQSESLRFAQGSGLDRHESSSHFATAAQTSRGDLRAQNVNREADVTSRLAQNAYSGSMLKTPSYIGGLRKTQAPSKDQLYAEDLGEGLFDNWKFLTPKNKPWMPDFNQAL
jgi:thiol-disulfide isomerase/thioredoxin